MRSSRLLMLSLAVLAYAALAMASSHDGHHDHHHHHGHDHGEHAGADHALSQLSLNDGKKWATDAPLRREMGKVRKLVSDKKSAVKKKSLGDEDFSQLAGQVHSSIMTMFKECKLPADADANLHIVLAEMLAGVSGMKGEMSEVPREKGYEQVLQALNAYHSHFEDKKFKPIAL